MRAFRYQLPLRGQLNLAGQSINDRSGILLHSPGSWSEVAPLPGFSVESLDDALCSLRGAGRHGPAVEFGLASLGIPWQTCSVPVNALLAGTPGELLERCREVADSAHSVVKLKLGRQILSDDLALVGNVQALLRADQRLRLDANRSWTFEDACSFAANIEHSSVEYVEEPLHDASRLEEFHSVSGMNYALDETVTELRSLESFPRAAALICKPTLLGSEARIRELVNSGKTVVFSGCFESGVGIARLTQLAAKYSPEVPAGLDTYRWLARDVVSAGLEFAEGRCAVTGPIQVDEKMLEEVTL